MSEIVRVFVKHGFAELVHRMHLSRFLPNRSETGIHSNDIPIAQRLRMSFEELGPTFVKLGQLLATRSDLLPDSVIEEFSKLQDNVNTLSFSEIESFIESEWKKPIASLCTEFSETPMAAASIAQVHGAVLRTGERVAIKIQRPGIAKTIHSDISILRGLSALLEKYVPESRTFNPQGIVEEFFNTILEELDFRIEANNIRRIQNNLSHFERVVIPKVYTDYSTTRILVMERFDGLRFSDREAIIARGMDPSDIVEIGSSIFFHMVMIDGLFHGDLHPGNLFILNDGKIGIIDFGIVGRLSRKVQDAILIMFTALVDEDYESLAYEYVNLCHSTGPIDIPHLQKELMDTISPFVGMSLGEVNVGRLLLRSTSIAVRNRLVVPRELMLLFKAMVTIEAMGKKLDPHFDLMKNGTGLARKVLTNRYSKERILREMVIIGRDAHSLIESGPRLLKRFLKVWAQNQFAFNTRNADIEELAKVLRLSSHALASSIFAVGLMGVGVALLKHSSPIDFFGFPIASWIFVGGGAFIGGKALFQIGKKR